MKRVTIVSFVPPHVALSAAPLHGPGYFLSVYQLVLLVFEGERAPTVRTTMQHPRPSTSTEKKPAKRKVGNDVIFVLGAGVDRVLHLPLLNTLFRDLNAFVSGPGADINKAIRGQAKGMRFNLQTHGGDEAENLGQKLLGSHQHLLPRILTALNKHPDAEGVNVAAIRVLLTKLSAIADQNELDSEIVAQLSRSRASSQCTLQN